jgi:hypothetical protein
VCSANNAFLAAVKVDGAVKAADGGQGNVHGTGRNAFYRVVTSKVLHAKKSAGKAPALRIVERRD